ncbi:succinate dehydrogenase iron-sulfur subunit [Candidatus Zinderia endosymbiont of Aphrophora alni]|uniref:succinate dehydrogenase iron-sulfur subunit n=1 Tax=Candidatus Zinderia endosymbiont of Aphrophora alni TaxID=3077951 RepID=UPI0030D1BFE3
MKKKIFKIYRYNPEKNKYPYMETFSINFKKTDKMLLDVMIRIKSEIDNSITFRKSCREGICGSDAININGKNGLACITNLKKLKNPIILKPLPGLPVIKDLVVDMKIFFKQYYLIKPYLINKNILPKKERLQSQEERELINGLYECILCACCTSSCPSFWWHPKKFIGPAGLLQAYRFIIDSRDTNFEERLNFLNDKYKLLKCKTIMNCLNVCPKNLNPTKAILKIKKLIFINKIKTFFKK